MLHAVAALSVSFLFTLSSAPSSLPQETQRPALRVDAAMPAAKEAAVVDDASKPSGSPVPEPATLLLVGTGLVGLAMSSRRWRRAPR